MHLSKPMIMFVKVFITVRDIVFITVRDTVSNKVPDIAFTKAQELATIRVRGRVTPIPSSKRATINPLFNKVNLSKAPDNHMYLILK